MSRITLEEQLRRTRNAGFHLRMRLARNINSDQAGTDVYVEKAWSELRNFYSPIFSGFVGADDAITQCSSRDVRSGVMLAVGHRSAMESMPHIRMLWSLGAPDNAHFVNLLRAMRTKGSRGRTRTGIEAYVAFQYLAPQKYIIPAGLRTFGVHQPAVIGAFADATSIHNQATERVLAHLGVDASKYKHVALAPSQYKNFSPTVRKLLTMSAVSRDPVISAMEAMKSGTEVAVGVVADARAALRTAGCSNNVDIHTALVNDIDVLGQSFTTPDLISEARYERDRNLPNRRLPFVARWSPEKRRFVLESRYPLRVPSDPFAGVCAGAEALEPVLQQHILATASFNDDLAAALRPTKWAPTRPWKAADITMLAVGGMMHNFALKGLAVEGYGNTASRVRTLTSPMGV